MTKVNLRLLLLAGAAACAATASAQTHSTATSTGTSAAHRSTSTAAHKAPVKSECVTIPGLSPSIPALPTGSPCPKSLITVSVVEKIDLSPLIGPLLREGFKSVSSNFTLAYVDQRLGTGALAQPHMFYTVQYTGYLADGTKFDSSYDHPGGKPLSFPYGAHRVIPGWDLGFEGMHVGGKRRLFIPYQLGYGERGKPSPPSPPPGIPPKSELIFDMELVAQNPTDPDAPPAPPTPPSQPGSPAAPGSPVTPGSPASPGSPAAPGAILGNPSTVNPVPGASPSPSARPQVGPDVKPTPPTPGAPPTLPATPPTQKQPPQE